MLPSAVQESLKGSDLRAVDVEGFAELLEALASDWNGDLLVFDYLVDLSLERLCILSFYISHHIATSQPCR